jgi:alpha-beta hydrolase superfamily lysophospholipase
MATPVLSPFELVGSDGGPLRGEVRTAGKGPRPAVVICHGFKGFKDWGFFPHLADRLARAGLTAVSFNFSGSGVGPDGESFSEPDRFGHATFGNDLRDLEIVSDALDSGALVPGLGAPTSLGLFGHSRGGGIGVLYAAAHPSTRSLVTWSAIGATLRWGPETIARWRRDGALMITNARTGEVLPLYPDVLDELDRDTAGTLDISGAAARVAAPWLIVHGESDESVSTRDARTLWRRSGERAELLVIPHGTHTFGARHPWAGITPELEKAMDATVGWFARTLF